MTETCPCGASYKGLPANIIGFRLVHTGCREAWQDRLLLEVEPPRWSPCPCDSASHPSCACTLDGTCPQHTPEEP